MAEKRKFWKLTFRTKDTILEKNLKLINGIYKEVISPRIFIVNGTSIYLEEATAANPRIGKWSIFNDTTINPIFVQEAQETISRVGYLMLNTQSALTWREVMVLKCEIMFQDA